MRSIEWGRQWTLLAIMGLFFTHSASQAGTTSTASAGKTGQAVAAKAAADIDAARSVPPVTLRTPSGKLAVKSSAALVLDADSDEVLYAKQAQIAAPVASITKLMTALVVLEADQPMDELIQITKEDRDTERGSTSRLSIGTKLSRGDLLHLALMSSENRAAHALGREYPGGLKAFIRAMNAKAKQLGMTRTRFVDPTGLSGNNVASPQDLAKLVLAASRNPTIRRLSTDEQHVVRTGKQLLEFRNTNTLVSNPGWDVVVQKTGYISEAGKCLVMQAVIDGRSVVIVLLNSFGKYTRTADAKRIRTWMEAGPANLARAR